MPEVENKYQNIGIIGLGYVGLPLAMAFLDKVAHVKGFDKDRSKIDILNKGESYIRHLDPIKLQESIRAEKFHPTDDFSKLQEVDAIIICVPTPLTKNREPDLSYVESTARVIRDNLQKGQLVVLESTTYPGTTNELMLPILEESGLKCGKDFLLAFSPEREDPGNKDHNTVSIPKIVGGVNQESTDAAVDLYGAVLKEVVPVSSNKVAEATKLTENIFRSVNIALVNELKVIYARMGIDIWEVLDAAETKPFGFMRFNPGPGLGGHCIPLDPFYLSWKAREHGISTKFIELAGEINTQMPIYVIRRLQEGLNEQGKAVKGSRVLLLGLAYKADVDDPRESPSFELMDLLEERGAAVDYHDPYIPKTPVMRSWPKMAPRESVRLTEECLKQFDAVLLVTAHKCVDYDLIEKHSNLLVDTRGMYKNTSKNMLRA